MLVSFGVFLLQLVFAALLRILRIDDQVFLLEFMRVLVVFEEGGVYFLVALHVGRPVHLLPFLITVVLVAHWIELLEGRLGRVVALMSCLRRDVRIPWSFNDLWHL